jgi:arylsulfatase
MAEGGIRNALIVSGPAVARPKGTINDGVMHVADIMPTLLEIAGTNYPKTYEGREVPELFGKSWNRMLQGQVDSPRTERDELAWEIFGNRAVRQGDWKLRWQHRPFGTGQWELFNLAADPSERKDLAAERPDKVRQMVALWDRYARTNNVILPSRSMFETLEDQLPPRVADDPGYPPLMHKRQFVPPADMLADPPR